MNPIICNMEELRENHLDVYTSLPEVLHSISHSEDALLERSSDHYVLQRNLNRIVVALLDNTIIGSVGMLKVSPSISEVSGAWVREEYRGLGVGSLLHNKLGEVATKIGDILYSTVKPQIPGNFPEVLINARDLHAYPVSFQHLSDIDSTAFHGCCSCDETRNHISCSQRDVTCFLLMQGISQEKSISFMRESGGWKSSIQEGQQLQLENSLHNHS